MTETRTTFCRICRSSSQWCSGCSRRRTCRPPSGFCPDHRSVARKTRGVNVNLLAADGPERLERIRGMAHLTDIPVDVRPAPAPQAATWSGVD